MPEGFQVDGGHEIEGQQQSGMNQQAQRDA
jgi:hypothetical protein